MSKYMPYSKRNNIADPDIAGLLDYLQMEMGYTVEYIDEGYSQIITYGDFILKRYYNGVIGVISILKKIDSLRWEPIKEMSFILFIKSYKTLLPVIRDLYILNNSISDK